MATTTPEQAQRGGIGAFAGGMGIGTLGGLIGLGGAEFRLPLLIGMFRFGPLEAVIVNKEMSLVVVAAALPFRAGTTSVDAIAGQWPVIVNLLAGSLSLAVSLPTMLVGFARYSRDSTFGVLLRNRRFVVAMAARSIAGGFIGALLLGIMPGYMLLPALAVILLISAVKVWRHK